MARALYDIENDIISCFDVEGNLLNEDKLNELMMEKERKFEGVALWIKNLRSENDGMKAEIETFQERIKSNTNKIEGLENWLAYATNGETFKTAKCEVTFRNSESVEIDDETIIPKKWLKKTITFKPDKVGMKAALKIGTKIKGVHLQINRNMKVK